MGNYQYRHHIVYTDNYYTSLKLARYSLSTGTDLVGTIGRTSRGFPHINNVRLWSGFKLANSDSIVVRRYVDKRDVYSLSTATHVPKTTFNNVERELTAEMLLDHGKYTGGVDGLDQVRSHYEEQIRGATTRSHYEEPLRYRKKIKTILAIYSIQYF